MSGSSVADRQPACWASADGDGSHRENVRKGECRFERLGSATTSHSRHTRLALRRDDEEKSRMELVVKNARLPGGLPRTWSCSTPRSKRWRSLRLCGCSMLSNAAT